MKKISEFQSKNGKNVAIVSLGCKVNQYESDSIALKLSQKGYAVGVGLVPADIYIINSCAVTNEGEKKSRGIVAKILKINPNAKIYVCGCAAQHAPQKFALKPNVCYVCGTAQKLSIVDAIVNDQNGINLFPVPTDYDDTMQSMQTKTRAFLKIQDGCNSFCSYCIIPYLRGRSRSRTVSSIKNELDQIASQEVVFVGVDVSEYGKDLASKPTLVDVVELMRGRKARFRFSSLEMGSVSPELLEHLKTMDNFCPHFHLSMQSGSNGVLKRMNRKHSKEDFLSIVENIRQVFPNAGITTDVIVGFPYETDEEFEETIQTCVKANFFEMHVFPYSSREGTVASRMPELNGVVVKERAKQLGVLAKRMKTEFLKKQIGLVHEVLVETIEDGIAEGYAKNYVRVRFQTSRKTKEGNISKVLCETANGEFVFGREI